MSNEENGADGTENLAEGDNTAKSLTTNDIVDERGVKLSNVFKEVTRKLSRVNDLNTKLDLILQGQQARTVDNTSSSANANLDASVKDYIDARLVADKKAEITSSQQAALKNTYKTFPELDQNSDSFDSDFFQLAIEHEKFIDINDPQRPMKAAKLAALELGKLEKLATQKVLQDEARRSRILGEGSVQPKDTPKKSSTASMNKQALTRLLKIDPALVEKFAKEEE